MNVTKTGMVGDPLKGTNQLEAAFPRSNDGFIGRFFQKTNHVIPKTGTLIGVEVAIPLHYID